MAKTGIGVLGYAHGHVNAYSQRIKTYDDFELIACWDHDEDRAAQHAENFEIDYSPHLEDVVDRDDIQLCIVGAETNRHAKCVVAAAERGKDVILQKPMALTIDDCDRIIDVVDNTGIWFSLAYQMRYDPVNIRIKELVDSGAIGRVGVVRRRHCLNVLFSEGFVTGPSKWHIDPEANIGMWMDDASHAADWFYWMLGQPVSVMAEVDNVLTDVSNDDTGMAIYRFKNGEMGMLLNSSVIWAAEQTVEIYGDEGVILENYGDGPSLYVPPPEGAIMLKMYQHDRHEKGWQILPAEIPEGQGVRIANVTRNILDEYNAGEVQVDARAGKIGTEMVLGAYQSAETGQRVSLPLSE